MHARGARGDRTAVTRADQQRVSSGSAAGQQRRRLLIIYLFFECFFSTSVPLACMRTIMILSCWVYRHVTACVPQRPRASTVTLVLVRS